MSVLIILTVVSCAFNFVLSDGPCKLTEESCLTNLNKLIFSNLKYEKLVNGDPELGIESLDPMHQDLIDGNLSILKYSIQDSDTYGFKECKPTWDKIKFILDIVNAVTKVTKASTTYNEGVLSFHVGLLCPKFDMKGKYEINGRLIIIPVEGKGDFFLNSNRYNISIDAELKIATGKDGNTHLSVKNFKQVSDPLDSIKFDFKNLFNGQKDLADAVLKFANENWYEVAQEVQDPIFNAHARKLINNINKYLKKIPLNNIVML